MIEVLNPGLLTSIQDLGRPGLESLGMPASGAFDPFLCELANRLAGNAPRMPLIEFALIGPSLTFESDAVLVLAAVSCKYRLAGETVPAFTAIPVKKGAILEFVSMESWFGYIAVAGGIDAPQVQGSSSAYLAGNLGQRVVRGTRLKTGRASGASRSLSSEIIASFLTRTLWLLPGLHTDDFSREERMDLEGREYRIDPQSNRMGIGLLGPPIQAPGVKRSAPTLRGTIQVLPSLRPLILGPEGPVTGGYPQLCIVSRTSWMELAGLRPGSRVQLKWTDPESAVRMWEERERVIGEI